MVGIGEDIENGTGRSGGEDVAMAVQNTSLTHTSPHIFPHPTLPHLLNDSAIRDNCDDISILSGGRE